MRVRVEQDVVILIIVVFFVLVVFVITAVALNVRHITAATAVAGLILGGSTRHRGRGPFLDPGLEIANHMLVLQARQKHYLKVKVCLRFGGRESVIRFASGGVRDVIFSDYDRNAQNAPTKEACSRQIPMPLGSILLTSRMIFLLCFGRVLSSLIFFTAYGRWSSRFLALNTLPNPPLPISSTSSKSVSYLEYLASDIWRSRTYGSSARPSSASSALLEMRWRLHQAAAQYRLFN